jgi:DNA polymerase III alpha subunit
MLKEQDLVELLYQERESAVTIDAELLAEYQSACRELGLTPRFTLEHIPADPHQHWNMPVLYQDLDLDVYFAGLISTPEQIQRVTQELDLFRENGLEPMLRFMIYMVDIMRENHILWGVGRGSSVSSYLLFLIGLHSVDAIKYNLDIKEFIK